MFKKASILLAALFSLSACVVTPRIEIPDNISFNYYVPNQQPMSYSDVLCCYDCNA